MAATHFPLPSLPFPFVCFVFLFAFLFFQLFSASLPLPLFRFLTAAQWQPALPLTRIEPLILGQLKRGARQRTRPETGTETGNGTGTRTRAGDWDWESTSGRQLLHKLPMNVARRRVRQSSRSVGKAKSKWIPFQLRLRLQPAGNPRSWTATIDVDNVGGYSFQLSRQCVETIHFADIKSLSVMSINCGTTRPSQVAKTCMTEKVSWSLHLCIINQIRLRYVANSNLSCIRF